MKTEKSANYQSGNAKVVRTMFNYQDHRSAGKIFNQKLKSRTIPDMTMGMRELVTRFASGQTLGNLALLHDGTGEEIGVDYRELDFSERQAYLDAKREITQELAKKAKDEQKKRIERKKYEAQLDLEMEAKRIAEKMNSDKGGSEEKQ